VGEKRNKILCEEGVLRENAEKENLREGREIGATVCSTYKQC